MTVKASEWLAHEPEADCDLSGHITLSCRAEPKHENAAVKLLEASVEIDFRFIFARIDT